MGLDGLNREGGGCNGGAASREGEMGTDMVGIAEAIVCALFAQARMRSRSLRVIFEIFWSGSVEWDAPGFRSVEVSKSITV